MHSFYRRKISYNFFKWKFITSDIPYSHWLGQRGYNQGLCELAGALRGPQRKTNAHMLPASQVKNLSFHDSQ